MSVVTTGERKARFVPHRLRFSVNRLIETFSSTIHLGLSRNASIDDNSTIFQQCEIIVTLIFSTIVTEPFLDRCSELGFNHIQELFRCSKSLCFLPKKNYPSMTCTIIQEGDIVLVLAVGKDRVFAQV